DEESEQRRPDPVAGVPAETLAPGLREPAEDATARPEPQAAFEAVLLTCFVGRSTARAETVLASLHAPNPSSCRSRARPATAPGEPKSGRTRCRISRPPATACRS